MAARFNGTGMAPETTSDLQIGMVAGLFRFSDDLKTVSRKSAESYPVQSRCQVLHGQAAPGHQMVGRRAIHCRRYDVLF